MNALPSFDLTGQVALVTGAARGLGSAIAIALAEAGADVALGLRELGCDAGLEAEIVARGRRTRSLQMDVSDVGQIQEAVANTAQQFGRLDILVNNAGIALGDLAEYVCEEDFDRMTAINLKGTFFASQAAGRIMIEQRSGHIINVSSQAGFSGHYEFMKPIRTSKESKCDCPEAATVMSSGVERKAYGVRACRA